MNTREPQETARRAVDALTKSADRFVHSFKDIAELPATLQVLSSDPPTQMAVLRECIDRLAAMRKRLGKPRRDDSRYMNLHFESGYPAAALQLAGRLLRRGLPWSNEDIAYLINRTADLEMTSVFCLPYLPLLVKLVERQVGSQAPSADMRTALERLRRSLEWEDNAAEPQALLTTGASRPGPQVGLY